MADWGFWDWLTFFLFIGFLTGWGCYLVDCIDDWCRSRFPRRCALCHQHHQRPGDVLCIYCTQLLRRPPEPLYLDKEGRRG